jgi:hypothetical protein
MTAMNLATMKPAIPSKNILLIAGVHDVLCPTEDIKDLWQSWRQPDIWRLDAGHVGICCGLVPGLPGRILRWLSPRLNAPAVQARPQTTLPDNAELQEDKRVIPSALGGINP